MATLLLRCAGLSSVRRGASCYSVFNAQKLGVKYIDSVTLVQVRLSSTSPLNPDKAPVKVRPHRGQVQPATLFSEIGPQHLYSNKQHASVKYVSKDYGKGRAKMYVNRIWTDPWARNYIMIVAVGMSLLFILEEVTRDTNIEQHGLIGEKVKKFRSRLTVVLDLDETICSYGDKAYRTGATVAQRPHLSELLDYLTEIDAEVIIWAASSYRYMTYALENIDPSGLRVTRFIVRDKEWYTGDEFYEKNLYWLKRDMNDIIMVENRALTARSCNANTILVPDFIRAEYMETGQDYPPNDKALLSVKQIIKDLEESGKPVPEYLADRKNRCEDIKEIPCHFAIRQMPDELAKGEFYFLGDKYTPGKQGVVQKGRFGM